MCFAAVYFVGGHYTYATLLLYLYLKKRKQKPSDVFVIITHNQTICNLGQPIAVGYLKELINGAIYGAAKENRLQQLG